MRRTLRRTTLVGLCGALGGLAIQASADATVSGRSVTIAANATDNIGVVGVQFLLDNLPIGPEKRVPPYTISWDSTTVPDGRYTLTARARDAAGNRAVSPPVPIVVGNGELGDTVPPAVTFTSPASGAILSGTVPVSASASDDVGVAGVQFLLNGQPLGAEDTSAPYTVLLDSTVLASGPYTLAARVRDAAGNQAVSLPVSVIVDHGVAPVTSSVPPPANPDTNPDTTSPTAAMTGPAHGSTVSGVVSVMAGASDDVGVAGVQFLLDGQPLGSEDRSAPYAIGWDSAGVPPGLHTLAARARDGAGNQWTSPSIAVIVEAPPAGPGTDPHPGDAPSFGYGTVSLTVNPSSSSGFLTVRASSDAGNGMEIYVDGERRATQAGRSLNYSWDVRQLLGSHEVRVVATQGSDIVASSTLFHSVLSSDAPSVELAVVKLGFIGATFLRARSSVGGATRTELYVDGELRVSRDASGPIEHAWAPARGRRYQVLLVTYNATGVVASVSIVHMS